MTRSSNERSPRKSELFWIDKPEWQLCLNWTVVTAIGVYLLLNIGNSILIALVLGLIILVVGQWILLRPRIQKASWWIPLTPVGYLVGAILGGIFGGNVQDLVDGISSSPLGIAPLEPGRTHWGLLASDAVRGVFEGSMLGLAQWIVLRGNVRNAIWWIPANVIAVGGSDVMNSLGHNFMGTVGWWVTPKFVIQFWPGIASNVWIGAVTGATLVWLLRRPRLEAVSSGATTINGGPLVFAGTVSSPAFKQETGKKRPKWWWIVSASATVLLTIAGVVYYLGTRNLNACQSKDPETSIKGCTELISQKEYFTGPAKYNDFYTEVYTNRGVSYDELKQFDASISDLNEAIRLDPTNARARLELGVTFQDMSRTDEAIASYGDAIRVRPDYSLALRNRGRLLTDKGEFDRAIADFDNAIRLDQRDGEAFYFRGVAYQKKDNPEKATADYRKALELSPTEELPRTALKALGVNPD